MNTDEQTTGSHRRWVDGQRMWLLVAAIAATSCGGEDGTDHASLGSVEAEIIGGSALNQDVTTRRTMGLVDVGTGCSGALFHQDWVITATHCLDRSTISNNTFSIPRTDAGADTRTATHITALSTSDIAIVRLSAVTAAMMWPNVTRSMNTASASSLVGTSVTCYGRGFTNYKSPGPGLEGGGWRSLVKNVAALESHATKGPELRINATNDGSEIIAYGDSGGACFSGNLLTAVVTSTRDVTCTNPSTSDTCKTTTTKIGGAGLRVTSTFSNYIQQSSQRTANAQFFPIALNEGWTLYSPSFPLPEYALAASSSVVQLRGSTRTDVANNAPFTLPAAARPSARVYVPVVVLSGDGPSNGRLVIESNGMTSINFEGSAPALPHTVVLDGVQFAKAATSTTEPTLTNNWVAAASSTRPPRVRKVSGTVYFQGAISNASTTASAEALTLATGFRPSNDVYVPVGMCNSTRGRLKVTPAGVVTVQAEGAFSNATCFTSLEGASFATTATGYTNVAYANGWTGAPFSTRHLRFINDGGIVQFQGAVAGGTSAPVITLPQQFRPATAQFFWIDGCDAKKTLGHVDPSGIVMSLPHSGGHDSCFASFEGATFGL